MNPQGQQPSMQQTLQLEDIHLPPAPGLWPPAPGWWLMAVLLLVSSWFVGKKIRKYFQRRQRLQETKRQLQQLKQQLDSGKTQQAITDINILLRNIALTHFPDEDVASLTGNDWLAFLDRSGNTNAFSCGPGKVLAEGPYLPAAPEQFDRDGLYHAVKQWVETVQKKQRDPSPRYQTQQRVPS